MTPPSTEQMPTPGPRVTGADMVLAIQVLEAELDAIYQRATVLRIALETLRQRLRS